MGDQIGATDAVIEFSEGIYHSCLLSGESWCLQKTQQPDVCQGGLGIGGVQ